MCIVIDANTLSPVFNKSNSLHSQFRPVLSWILDGEGKMVYGGTKYRKELNALSKLRGLLIELKKSRKIAEINDKLVDSNQKTLEKKISHRNFDDPHIIAIFIVSHCKLFCSKDRKADKFIKNPTLYPPKHPVPKIYRYKDHCKLLCRDNLVKLQNII